MLFLTNEHDLAIPYNGCTVCRIGSGEFGTQKGTFGGVASPLDEKDGHGYTIIWLLYDSVSVSHLCHSGIEYNNHLIVCKDFSVSRCVKVIPISSQIASFFFVEPYMRIYRLTIYFILTSFL